MSKEGSSPRPEEAAQTTGADGIVVPILIALLSVLVPAGIAGWTVTTFAHGGSALGRPSNLFKLYQGPVRNGELWLSVIQLGDRPPFSVVDTRFKRLNLQAGVESDTGIVLTGDMGYPIWLGETLYIVSQTAFYEVVGTSIEPRTAIPRSPGLHAGLFLYGDRVTTVRQTDDGYCLTHLIDGQWKDGRPILLPDPGRVWDDHLQNGRQALLPRTSQQPVSGTTPLSHVLYVVSQGGQYHLMISNHEKFTAYRTGFEFADEPEIASALAPKNAPREVSGWEPVAGSGTGRWMQMTVRGDELLFNSWDGPNRFFRRTAEGEWEDLSTPGDLYSGMWVVSDSKETAAYHIDEDQIWGSAEIGRIDETTIQPPHLKVPGFESEYLGRWQRLLVGLLSAWLIHFVILLGGAHWVTQRDRNQTYEFGVQQEALAAVWRRILATTIDVALLGLVLILLWKVCFVGVGITQPKGTKDLAHSLLDVEKDMTSGSRLGWVGSLPRRLINAPAEVRYELFGLLTGMVLVICGLKVFIEGRQGRTPGKWLLGLQTVRTTLRPCGLERILVRNVLYCFDIPFLLTPLPGILSLMLSESRQTLGDRVAGTVVIRAGSIR